MPDHIHMCLGVPPKFSVAFLIGFLKGKSAIRIHREILKVKRSCRFKKSWQTDTYSHDETFKHRFKFLGPEGRGYVPSAL